MAKGTKGLRVAKMKNSKRNERGQFIPKGNRFEISDGVLKCFHSDGSLLFFTDTKNSHIKKHYWCKLADGYSATHINGKQVAIHRFLMNPPKDKLVDHINRDTKDNRLSNLRIGDKSLNALNSKIGSNNLSGYTGVRLRKDTRKWVATIKVNYKSHSLGCYATKCEAIKARRVAEEYFLGVM